MKDLLEQCKVFYVLTGSPDFFDGDEKCSGDVEDEDEKCSNDVEEDEAHYQLFRSSNNFK
jgi:hypothetical protein